MASWTEIEGSPSPKAEPVMADTQKCDCICEHLIIIEEMLTKILSHYETKEPESKEEIVIGYHERQSVVK